jgi:hypothetical protein
LTGKINNWRNLVKPETKSKASPVATPESEFSDGTVLSATTLKTSQTAATTVSLAKDPPPSLTESSEGDEEEEEDRDGDNDIDEDGDGDVGGDDADADVDADADDEDNNFEEPALVTNGKVKASLKVSHGIKTSKFN